jgi:hypothetical protein
MTKFCCSQHHNCWILAAAADVFVKKARPYYFEEVVMVSGEKHQTKMMAARSSKALG